MTSACLFPIDLRPSRLRTAVMPKPVSLRCGEGDFTLTRATRILCDPQAELVSVAGVLRDALIAATGFELPIADGAPPPGTANVIALRLLPKTPAALGNEGYELTVTPAHVDLRAAAPAGILNGIQTLRQLLPVEIFSPALITRTPWTMPAVEVVDYPRYAWRGLMLDAGRHFFDTATIFTFLDAMALHKLNVFHFHLTEDQGWRVDVRAYPELARVAAARRSSPVIGSPDLADGRPYGPYLYTPEDLRAIVAHAARLHITVVPEIEMPGHCQAALAAYPELSCTGGPFEVSTRWGVHEDVYCAGQEATFTFLEGVLDEILDIFPSRFVHIGGDECPKTRWQNCPACQARMRQEGLKDEHELQSWFVRRMDRYLAGKGRRLIGWDEILEGGLSEGATVMSWRGTAGGVAAARQGHDVVLTPNSHLYFDYYQSGDRAREPEAIGGNLPLPNVYAFDPALPELTEAEGRHVLGVQGNVWTEYIASPRKVEFMTYPRAAALAEMGWTPQAGRQYADFHARLQVHYARYAYLNLHARPLDA